MPMLKKFWAGSEESHTQYLADLPKAQEMAEKFKADNTSEPDQMPDFPSIYELVNGVGVVTVEGSTIPGEAGFMRYFGYIGYDDIKNALVQAVQDPKAKSIMFLSRSGGGAVSGVMEAVSFARKVGQVKPLSAYADFMASAAYWLGSVARHITIPETGVAGSIGVLRVMTEYSRAYEKEGVTKLVMKAGRYKALGNPYEPFSEEAKAEVQSKLDDLYTYFATDVASNRGTSYMIADQVMGQGREFLGKRAVEAGLADIVGTYEDALAYAAQNRRLFSAQPVNFNASVAGSIAGALAIADNTDNTFTGNPMIKKTLTVEQLAALAAGVPLAVVTAPEQTPEEIAAAAAARILSDAAAASAAEAVASASAAEASAAKIVADEALAAEAATIVATDSALVAYLKTELATAQANQATASGQLTAAASQVSALEATEATLKGVIQGVVANLSIATRKSSDTTNMTAEQLVAEYNSQATLLTETFKVGGVAASTASTAAPTSNVKPLFSPREIAAAKAIPVPKRK